jgi:hypothetical protein
MATKTLKPTDYPNAIEFTERLLDTAAWIRKADELVAAARLLALEIRAQWAELVTEDGHVVHTSGRADVQGAFFVLVAYAIENLTKAALIHREKAQFRNRLLKSLPAFLSSHDLTHLAGKAGFSMSIVEQDLLVRLSRNSVWAGRYPVPTGPDALSAMAEYADGRSYLTACFYSSDVEQIELLFRRMRSSIISEVEGAA